MLRSQSSNSTSKPTTSPPRFNSPLGPPMHNTSPSTLPASSPGFLQTMKEGVALGAGSAIGSRIVSGIFGPPSVEVKTSTSGSNSAQSTSPPTVYGSTAGSKCELIQTAFNTCIQERKPIDTCEETLELLNKCLSASTK